jgi:hypothetical protein
MHQVHYHPQHKSRAHTQPSILQPAIIEEESQPYKLLFEEAQCYDSQTILFKTIGNYSQSWKASAKWARAWVSKPYLARRENRSKWKPWEVCIICQVYIWRQFIIHHWICNWISVQKLPCLTQWQVLLQAFPS